MDVASLPITALKGVGPKLADKLTRLHLHSVQDVLFHLPLRYQDRTHITSLGRLKPGMEVVVLGKVELTDVVYKGRRSLVCRLSDDTGFINLRFFHFSAIQQRNLQRGHTILAFGEVRFGPAGLEMVHPEYGVYADEQAAQPESALTPIYPATEGVHQLHLAKLADKLTRLHLHSVQDVLFHLPLRYQDRTHITSLGRLKPGMEVVVLGKVELTDVVYKGRRSLVCRLSDDTGFINLRFFHFSAIQQRNLQRGHTILAFGEVRFGQLHTCY